MKKIFLATNLTFLLFTCMAQNETLIAEATPILPKQAKPLNFNSNPVSNQAKWKETKGGVRVDLGNFTESNYLTVNIEKPNFSIDNSNTQKVILNIAHLIELQPNVDAEIEYTLDGKTWQKFIPITNYLLNITKTGYKTSQIDESFKNQYPPIVFAEDANGGNDYDKLYKIHVAGTNDEVNDKPKINLIDVNKIKAFRFRLIKTKSKSYYKSKPERGGADSFWQINKLSLNFGKYAKKNLPIKKAKKNTSNPMDKSAKPRELEQTIPNQLNTNRYDDEGGVCPLPHGH